MYGGKRRKKALALSRMTALIGLQKFIEIFWINANGRCPDCSDSEDFATDITGPLKFELG